MLFCSWSFAQFFALFFALYWLIPWRHLRLTLALPGRGGRQGKTWVLTGDEARVWLLLGASYSFYTSWSHKLALIVVASTLVDYFIALAIEKAERPRLRRGLLLLSLTANLGLLCYFKYANFFLTELAALLQRSGLSCSLGSLSIIAPIGISFYTFEAINYVVEVYWRRIPAERNPAHLLFFVLFFPHLIAGPIVRGHDFLPQINRAKRWSWMRAQAGLELFLLGLLKKVVIADSLSHFADPVFKNPTGFGSTAHWLALLSFAFQVYCDFSGYSDMALGCAHLFGYKLAQNFNMPFLSANVSEFWRRWHISLSTWLRDYLFIPLGGSRGSGFATCRNLLLTMTLGGLWHGASWNFVLWGVLHGVLLCIHRVFRSVCTRWPGLDALLQTGVGTALRCALTFLCVCQTFVLFRSTSFAATTIMFQRLWMPVSGPRVAVPCASLCFTGLVLGVVLFHLAGWRRWWDGLSLRLPPSLLGAAYVAALLLCMMLAPVTEKPFIYFVF